MKFTSCFYNREESKLHRLGGDTVPLTKKNPKDC